MGSSVPIKLFFQNKNKRGSDYIRKAIIGIYCIENMINGKKYIGQSVNIKHRWRSHKRELNNGCHDNDYLQKSWNKYGESNFRFYIIETCEKEKLDEKEIYYMKLYDVLNRDKGYNLKEGGKFGKQSKESIEKTRKALIGHKLSEESRRKISENHADVSGENNPNFGKHLSEDAKRRIGEANKGKISARRNLTPVLCIELNKVFGCAAEAAIELNLLSGCILQCCYKKRKTHAGYHWEFTELEK